MLFSFCGRRNGRSFSARVRGRKKSVCDSVLRSRARIKKCGSLSEAALSCLIAWVVVFPPVKLLHVV